MPNWGNPECCQADGLFPARRRSCASIARIQARRVRIISIASAYLDESKFLKPVHGLKQRSFHPVEGIIPTTCWIRRCWAKSCEFETGAPETGSGQPIPNPPRRSRNCCRNCTSPDRKESFGRLRSEEHTSEL